MERLAERIYTNLIAEGRYKLFINGIGVTLSVSFFAVLIGTFIGLFVALARLFLPDAINNIKKRNQDQKGYKKVVKDIFVIFPLKAIVKLCSAYIDIIRGTPSYIQILIFNFVIFAGFMKVAFQAGCVAFGVNSGAYVAEIIRAGIQSVDRGQMEAGRSLGFSSGATLRLIILPQAVRNILPPLANEFIVLVKETAIIGYIGIQDLAKAASIITSRTFDQAVPLFAVALLYFIVIKILSILFSQLEKLMSKADY